MQHVLPITEGRWIESFVTTVRRKLELGIAWHCSFSLRHMVRDLRTIAHTFFAAVMVVLADTHIRRSGVQCLRVLTPVSE